MAIGAAIIIVAAVSVGINQSWLLTADILKWTDAVSAAGDISYKTDEQAVHVQSEKSFVGVSSLTFMVVYNPETVKIHDKEIKTSYDYTSSSGKEWVTHITVFLPTKVDAKQEIVSLPFEWEMQDITISDATMMFDGGTIDGLAIKKQ